MKNKAGLQSVELQEGEEQPAGRGPGGGAGRAPRGHLRAELLQPQARYGRIYILTCQRSRVSSLVSRVSCLVSSVPCPVSRVSCLVSRVPCLVSRVSCLMS